MDLVVRQNKFVDIFRGKRWASLRSTPTYDFWPNIRVHFQQEPFNVKKQNL